MTRILHSTAVLATLFLALVFTAFPTPGFATDVDGGDDCVRQIEDFGDAPEGIPAYSISAPLVIGAFPTCIVAGPVGTQSFPPGCAPISTPPGPTGYVAHRNPGFGNFWFGCYGVAGSPMGIESDFDGKSNTPPVGFSACNPGAIPTDCLEPAEGGFDQDECYGDGSDATLTTKIVFGTCANNSFPYSVYLCPSAVPAWNAHLNVLVDWNQDGDWNDVLLCQTTAGTVCVYEWAVKNSPVTLLPGCNFLTTPTIVGGPLAKKNVWMRLSISTDPVTDDFPWAGTVNWAPGVDHVRGGETEDYLVDVTPPVPTQPQTWGAIKAMYR